MRNKLKFVAIVVSVMLVVVAWALPALATTNSANNVAGGGTTLTNSGDVTVTSAGLQLVKQVWDTSSPGICLASIPADVADCNSGATSVTVPIGTTLNFLIYVKNTTSTTASNVRIEDVLVEGATDFTFVNTAPNSIYWNNNATATSATLATLFAASDDFLLTDVVGAPDDIASAEDLVVATPGIETIRIGTTTNTQLDIPAGFTFGFRFQVVKN